MSYPKVSIIILNWNGLEDTLECLESVFKLDYPNFEVIVVDNGSTDDSVRQIRQEFPDVVIIENGKNLGFAEGNNVGIRYAIKNGAEYVLLLNNDTVVDPQLLNAFVEASQLYPEAGIFGAKIYYYSEPNRIWDAGAKWNQNIGKFYIIGENQLDNENKFEQMIEVDYACGCSLFFRTALVSKIGLLDQRFFLTWEETDWCYSARRAGFKCLYVPKAKVWHKVSASFGGNHSPLFRYFYIRNRLLWAQRNLPFSKRWDVYKHVVKELFPCLKLKEYPVVKRIYWDIYRCVKKPQVKAQLLGLRDFVLRRFGDCPKGVHRLKI
ncbi:MAG TPA: glycosyltransferase family 2 protein [Syntrophaceae bacterium]|nr:glycosyltransferase family 2 protein [Syntrophaceae bacterium]